jgi:two-component system chemotaxis sensor kinase CheA
VDQSQREFLIDIDDLIEQIFESLYQLRQKQDDGRHRRELLDEVFRRVHSVKGLAASIGLNSLSDVAHEIENLLEAVRAGRTRIDDAVLDAIEDAANTLSGGLTLSATGTVGPSPGALFERIRGLAQGNTAARTDTETILNELPSDIWQSLSEDEKRHVVGAIEEGAQLFVIPTNFDIADFDEQFYRLKQKLAMRGEIISTLPTVDSERPDKIDFRIVYASDATIQEVRNEAATFAGVTVNELSNADGANELSDDGNAGSPGSDSVPDSSFSNSIRLDLNKLDRLISLTHELLKSTTSALDLGLANCLDAQAKSALEKIANQIRQSFMAFEDETINLRMVSVDRILKRAVRAGRTAARLAKKEIGFEIIGMDLQLDKLLCDAIADPLLHLVRNAVDHGIETTEERLLAGKITRAMVRIEASSEGCRTRVRVTDDGRGINPEIVSRAAETLGIIDKGVTLSMDRSLRLIFRPGFSTLSSASRISGRGVGLDVVETAVEQVGGEVRVSSVPGRRSSFEIRLPVTFGLLRATVIASAGNHYCIDANQVISTETIEVNQIQQEEAGEVLRSEERVLPLLRLSEVLGQAQQEPDSGAPLNIITCQFSDGRAEEKTNKRIAIVVDRVVGTEEVLVRNLGSHAGRWQGIAGATELRDGALALVLDLPPLVPAKVA